MHASVYVITFLIISFSTSSFAQTANIAGKTKGEITKEELLNSKGLAVDDLSAKEYHISSFRMTVVIFGKGKEPVDIANSENGELNDLMRQTIKNAPSGCKIYIEYIKCTNKNDEARMMSPLNFVLK